MESNKLEIATAIFEKKLEEAWTAHLANGGDNSINGRIIFTTNFRKEFLLSLKEGEIKKEE